MTYKITQVQKEAKVSKWDDDIPPTYHPERWTRSDSEHDPTDLTFVNVITGSFITEPFNNVVPYVGIFCKQNISALPTRPTTDGTTPTTTFTATAATTTVDTTSTSSGKVVSTSRASSFGAKATVFFSIIATVISKVLIQK